MPSSRSKKPHGAIALAALLPKLTKPLYRARGFAEAGVLNDWPNIVGRPLADYTAPERLGPDGTLVARVGGAWALELQHLEPLVLDRIAGYFGYRAVTRLALVQGPLPPRPAQPRKRRPKILGKAEGLWVTTNKGHHLLAVKPTMADFTLEMPRIATVGYPKDMGAVLIYGDFFPGAKVLEAGCGSGAMTMTLLRAVGPRGMIYSYDIRQDMIDRARANVAVIVDDRSNLCFKLGDVYQGFDETDLDRIFLDLPEPWQVVPHAAKGLVPGGIIVSFLPTILQVHELVKELRFQRTFEIIETMEVLIRNWVVRGRSVRPDHRMIGHTGFIVTARKCEPRPGRPGDEDWKE